MYTRHVAKSNKFSVPYTLKLDIFQSLRVIALGDD